MLQQCAHRCCVITHVLNPGQMRRPIPFLFITRFVSAVGFPNMNRITSVATEGKNRQAIIQFYFLHKTCAELAHFSFPPILRACANLKAIQEGKQAHCFIIKNGFHSDKVVMTSLLDMYSKSSLLSEFQSVFDEMPERDIVANNSMVSGFFRFGLTLKAVEFFEKMSERDEWSWNSVVSGFSLNFEGKIGLVFFNRMRLEGVRVDNVTVVSVVSICANIAMSTSSKQVHGLVVKYGFESYLEVGNAIVDMYAKCGCMEHSYKFFVQMNVKNVISWTSLISGYGKHGLGMEAVKAFDSMEMEGVVPNKITFLSALYACSHAGLMHEGRRVFNTMVHKYSLNPSMEHYTCMVDLLGRAGRLNEAHQFIESMPVEPEAKLMAAFLSSCCNHKNIKMATKAAEKLLVMEPKEAGAYMLLSNFYGQVGDLENVANVRRLMSNKGIRKERANTWIEIDKKVHTFESGDRSHPQSEKIYSYLLDVVGKMKKIGYVPNTSMVMQNVEEHTKEEIVLGHSEKLAIALGIISTPPGTSIMIVKNLRVCRDCHEVTALISKIENRQIIARDSSRFHYFKDGFCSCGNHW